MPVQAGCWCMEEWTGMAENHGCQIPRLSDRIRASSVPLHQHSCEQITGCTVRRLHQLQALFCLLPIPPDRAYPSRPTYPFNVAVSVQLQRIRPAMCDGSQAMLADLRHVLGDEASTAAATMQSMPHWSKVQYW